MSEFRNLGEEVWRGRGCYVWFVILELEIFVGRGLVFFVYYGYLGLFIFVV